MSSFQERQKSLFNHLKEAEDQHKISKGNVTQESMETSADCGVVDRQTYRHIKSKMKSFRGKESIFKRPEAPISRCLRPKTLPGYVKNPQKWTHYTLADVTVDQMSEATNKATALALLKNLEEKELAEKTQCSAVEPDILITKPSFHISATIKKDHIEDDNKISFKDNKVIMPEYVVGVSDRSIKKRKDAMLKNKGRKVSVEKKTELKLQHLYDEED